MIKKFIQNYLLAKLSNKNSLLIYDPNVFYKKLVLEMETEDIKVFDASKNVVKSREDALEYWVNEMPFSSNKKLIMYIPFSKKEEVDEITLDPFIIFSSGGDIFPDQAADNYKELCIAALPDKAEKIEEFFKQEDFPSFEAIDALKGGNEFPKLKSGLAAESDLEILMAILAPSSRQLDFLKKDKTWYKELIQFTKTVLEVNIQSKKLQELQDEMWLMVLFSEFVHDLPLELPKELKQVSLSSKKSESLIKKLCKQLRNRKDIEELYINQANRISEQLSLQNIFKKETRLGKINTFAFEDTSFYNEFKNYLIKGNTKEAIGIVNQSFESIWTSYDDTRRTSWLIAKKACEIIELITVMNIDFKNLKSLNEIVQWYASKGYLLDTLHRELDKNIAELIDVNKEVKEVHKYVVDAYLSYMEMVQKKFLSQIESESLQSLSMLRNINLFDEKVEPLIKSGKKTVYFLADALRYELAAQLEKRLGRAAFNVKLEQSLAYIPTVTKFAMAALMPDASKKLELKIKGKKLEPFLNGNLAETRDARIKYTQNILGDKASWAWEKDILSGKYVNTDVLFVTTTEIDQAGENAPDNAQLLIEQSLNKILKVSSKLRDAGYEEFVLAADHGFVLVDQYKPGNKSDKPLGDWFLTKSRCVAGKGASNENHLELNASDIGVNSEVNQFLFLKNYATYERGKQFFHEGLSLQEIITPCLTYSPQVTIKKEEVTVNLTYKGKTTGSITTRRPSIELATFSDVLFGKTIDVAIEAVANEKVVGIPAISEKVNATTGYIDLEPGEALKFTLAMDDDFEGEFIVYAKSPSTGLILSELKLETDYL
ncbi:PglZ domain-containing protein [uncultured Lutibacter sp.]|uniref:PglZ domain-containing protein n=1 Tax=uncultured Lutibacter sp. TaxID=437739 RepID=UPI002610D5E1|nr:PglZ domain-containing protein [uncultured Lutibacter sp.]